ncbi:carbohydrate ABC transporter permease [Paenibacillus piri]|uniref:carbohydrate ABC transporter permease n=1 Tax=Paenibacillus piri TaxID=2547395 RepID=UPI0014050E94|nr:sugar ABC transporter permease [Paenibacillus piri]
MSIQHNLWSRITSHLHCYLWIAPFFIFFLIFELYPNLFGLYISFTQWDGFSPKIYVGLDNYKAIMIDPLFWKTLSNTFILWVFIIPLRTLLALVLASLVNFGVSKAKNFFSFFFLLPNITAIVVIAIIFRIFFATDGGIFNAVLHNIFGMDAIPWLQSEQWSKVSIALMNIWRVTGYFAIIMLAGLQQIPKNLYEAASIDGANPVRAFFSITVPMMSNVIFFVMVMSTIWIFQNIADSLVLTNGGPQFSSTTLMYYMYLNGFEYFKLGYASAISTCLFIILLVFSLIMFYVNNRAVK